MLLSLHVKNLALISEEEISFCKGLNILSGETGAGKSILLGALKLALGEKASKEFLRDQEKEALVEAVFEVSKDEEERLSEKDIEVYDNQVILTRKISASRATAKINGESVPAIKMKQAGEILLDIYGQHDHQSLLNKEAHLALLDDYAKTEISSELAVLGDAYEKHKTLKREYDKADIDESERIRERDFLQHEIAEIEGANLTVGEDISLEEEYHRLSNLQKIITAVSSAMEFSSFDTLENIGRAIRCLREVESFDSRLSDIVESLSDAEDIMLLAHRSLEDYLRDTDHDEKKFYEVANRLDEINRLKDKYSNKTDRLDEVIKELDIKKEKLEKLEDYENYISKLKSDIEKSEIILEESCEKVSDIRKSYAKKLSLEIKSALSDLNFSGVEFEIQLNRADGYRINGYDDVQFMISLNPGEMLRPLSQVASGGELSRIMLAIKTVWATEDSIDTLVFDEIDAGISGKTAAAVSEKLYRVSREHQVICITHLPQIAAMADTHYLIEKSVNDDRTISQIYALDENKSLEEIARMLGSTVITETTLSNARELKENARCIKESS